MKTLLPLLALASLSATAQSANQAVLAPIDAMFHGMAQRNAAAIKAAAIPGALLVLMRDGKLDHCGTDLFNLVKTQGKWRIAGIADTGNKDCAHQ